MTMAMTKIPTFSSCIQIAMHIHIKTGTAMSKYNEAAQNHAHHARLQPTEVFVKDKQTNNQNTTATPETTSIQEKRLVPEHPCTRSKTLI